MMTFRHSTFVRFMPESIGASNSNGTKDPILFLTRLLFLFLLLCILVGCQVSPQKNPDTERLLFTKKLQPHIIETSNYQLWALSPATKASDTLRIYIEGDGRAWLRRGVASTDPTPRNRLVHRLMLQDSKPDIAYLARPCQFVMNHNCTQESWTFGRYNKDALKALNAAVSVLKDKHHYKKLELVGYSGGATMALLIAANRKDVISIRTVAGNLSPEYTNRLHKVSPMPAALNPENYAPELSMLPQIHFYGEQDRVIRGDIAQHYQKQFTHKGCIQITAVIKASHSRHWSTAWPQLLDKRPGCR